MIRVVLPAHLRKLAQVGGELQLDVKGPPTQRTVLDALEASYPMLRGTIRDQVSKERRAFNGDRLTRKISEAGLVHLVDEIARLLKFD